MSFSLARPELRCHPYRSRTPSGVEGDGGAEGPCVGSLSHLLILGCPAPCGFCKGRVDRWPTQAFFWLEWGSSRGTRLAPQVRARFLGANLGRAVLRQADGCKFSSCPAVCNISINPAIPLPVS